MPIELGAAVDPLVLALDIGSTASRGGIYDAAGRPVRGRRHKVPHQFTTAADGTSEIDPDQVVREVEEILDHLADPALTGRIAAVGLDTFASSLVGVGADGRAVTGCATYADARDAVQAAALRAELDEAEVHDLTGCRIHTSYLPARLRWLREDEPDAFAGARRWVSLGEYVHERLLGVSAVGTSTAAWSGLLDRRTGQWAPRMLEAAGVEADQLGEIRDPDRPLTVGDDVARRWPALAGAAWAPVITDGFASNVGTGATDERTLAVAAATSGAVRVLLPELPTDIPTGLWCYRVSAGRWLLGGALNDVGRVATWAETTLQLPGGLADAVTGPPTAATPLVLPYLTGERAPGWAVGARAVVADLTASAGPAEVARGAMEGVALAYRRVTDELGAAGVTRVVASGRVSQDLPAWLQVLADALEVPVEHVTMKRTTLHGTALVALEHAAPGVERAPAEVGGTYRPEPGHADHYRRRGARFDELYRALIAP